MTFDPARFQQTLNSPIERTPGRQDCIMAQQLKKLLMADKPAVPDEPEQRNVSVCCDHEAAFHVPHQGEIVPPTRVNVAR
jgi:hypothetical protein